MKKSIILLSGGIESTTMLAWEISKDYECYAISFSYGQNHLVELEYAKRVAQKYKCIQHKIINLDFSETSNSSLTGKKAVPQYKSFTELPSTIPTTYVPARNTIFLSYAIAYAEIMNIDNIFIGINKDDSINYPDCSASFLRQFEKMANLGTSCINQHDKLKIESPFINLNKEEVIHIGINLGVDYSNTFSCYDPINKEPCEKCLSCINRKYAFSKVNN